MLSTTGPDWAVVLGLLATVALCGSLASWGLSHALAASGRQNVGPAAALAAWMPTALCVLVAMVLGEPTVAVTLIYATSLAAVTVVLGGALLCTPHTQDAAELEASAASSSMLSLGLPMAMLTWLIGFSGNVTPASALALLLGAGTTLDAWAHEKTALGAGPAHDPVVPASRPFRLMEAAIALALGPGGAWAAVSFTQQAANPLLRISPELLVVTPLGPLLLLPLFNRAAAHARCGRPSSSIALALGVVVLNLGILLPLTAVLRHLTPPLLSLARPGTTTPASTAAVAAAVEFSPHMSLLGIPLLLWRLDNLLLVLVSLAILGVRLGYYHPSRRMGVALLLLYVGYFMMTIVMRLA